MSRGNRLVVASVPLLLMGVYFLRGRANREAEADISAASPIVAVTIANEAGRSGAYYVPPTAPLSKVPVLFLMHPTGSSGMAIISSWRRLADSLGFVIIAPDSRVSPQGMITWQVGNRSGEVTPDMSHAIAVLDWVKREAFLDVDESRTLIAGHSGGASMAPYLATNRPRFSHAAILHGRAFPGGLGRRRVPIWISTGTSDELAPVAEAQKVTSDLAALGFKVMFRQYSGGHGVIEREKEELIRWWLGS